MKQARLLTKLEFKRLQAVIDGHRHPVRNQLIFDLSFCAGLRACEIASVLVGDVYGLDGTVRDTIVLQSSQTKGSEACTVLVGRRLARSLQRYAAAYPAHVLKRDRPLLFSSRSLGFTSQSMINLFKRFYLLAGIEGASSHSGRRQFLTNLAESGVSIRVIQALARHKHIGTTQRYIDVNDSKLRAALDLVG
jgi:integrase/recombinase XerD